MTNIENLKIFKNSFINCRQQLSVANRKRNKKKAFAVLLYENKSTKTSTLILGVFR